SLGCFQTRDFPERRAELRIVRLGPGLPLQEAAGRERQRVTRRCAWTVAHGTPPGKWQVEAGSCSKISLNVNTPSRSVSGSRRSWTVVGSGGARLPLGEDLAAGDRAAFGQAGELGPRHVGVD